MSISYPVTLVQSSALSIASCTFGLDFAVSRNISPFSYQSQTYRHPGIRWILNASYPSMNVENAKLVQACISSLKGFGSFTYRDPAFSTPSGSVAGIPVVNGGGQKGNSTVNLKGFTPGATGVLKAGDRFQIGTGYYMNLKDINADGSGHASPDIVPPIRTILSDGDSVITTDPVCLLIPAAPQVRWSTASDRVSNMTFDAIEAL